MPRIRIAAYLCILSGLVLLATGCARRDAVPYARDTFWLSFAPAESLTLAQKLSLPGEDRAARDAAADRLVERASGSRDDRIRLRSAASAVGLAPDRPEHWIFYAEETARVGDRVRALDLLRHADDALRTRPPEERRRWRVETALARAWLHRDRGEWLQSHAWADSAMRLSPDERETRLLQGLARADHGDLPGAFNRSRNIENKSYFWFEWRWIRGMAELADGNLDNAYHWLSEARPEPEYAARFYRDLAMVCERLDNLVEARRFYGYSFDALGLSPATCDGPQDVALPRPGGQDALLPAWTSLGAFYAAGSPQAWALAAVDSFRTAADPQRRAFWADQASDQLSICIRLHYGTDLCRALRGQVHAAMGAYDLAFADLRRAVPALDAAGGADALSLSWYGHLLGRKGRHREAIGVLQRAAALDGTNARTYCDLGYALLMRNELSEGEMYLDRALTLDPGLAAAWYNRGLARFHGKRWREAADDFRRALELAPENLEIVPLLQRAGSRARNADDQVQ